MGGLLIRMALVGVGGALGCLARYGLSEASAALLPSKFPIGTLLANFIGCLLVGVFGYFFVDRQALTPQHKLLLVTGFLGGLTTFSSFGYETLLLARDEDYRAAALNIAANLILSLAGVWGGWAGARAMWGT